MTLEKIPNHSAERVLDVACGTGLLLELLADRSDYSELVGIDRVPAMLNVAIQRLGDRAFFVKGEAAQLPFADANFQLIISTNALHYFQDVDASLREIRRVIAPSGSLVITDWCRNYFWIKVLNRILPWTQHAHVHALSISELEQSLSEASFSINSTATRKINWFWGLMTIHATPI
jgi:ubiquinone/menaquinone biosynthesis C-methylase UbiE